MSSSSFYFLFLMFVLVLMLSCVTFIYSFELYTLCPGWGVVQHFDSYGNEDLRINQLLMHQHVRVNKDINSGRPAKEQKGGTEYGALGACTWGYCQAPRGYLRTCDDYHIESVSSEKEGHRVYDVAHLGPEGPRYASEQVKERMHFADTQYMRGQSAVWAKDEPYFMAAQGVHPHPPNFTDAYSYIPQRLV